MSFIVQLLFSITVQKMKFPIKGFFSKCGQIRRKLWIWSHLLRKSLMENFIFFTVNNFHSILSSFVLLYKFFQNKMGPLDSCIFKVLSYLRVLDRLGCSKVLQSPGSLFSGILMKTVDIKNTSLFKFSIL